MKKLLFAISMAISLSFSICAMENPQALNRNSEKSCFNALPTELNQYIVKFIAHDQRDIEALIKNILSLRLINKDFSNIWTEVLSDLALWENIFASFFKNEIKEIPQTKRKFKKQIILSPLEGSKNLKVAQNLIKTVEELGDETDIWFKYIKPALSCIVNELELNLKLVKAISNNGPNGCDIEKIASIIEQKNNVKTHEGIWNKDALVLAAEFGLKEVVKMLLDAGSNINAHKSTSGETALISATWRCCLNYSKEHIEIIKMLIDNGIVMDAKDNVGKTALIIASCFGNKGDDVNLEIIGMLLAVGANIDAQANDGQTALISSVNSGKLKICQLLLEKTAAINIQANDGCTALMAACEICNLDIVEMLIEQGAEVNLQDKAGYTALMKCINGHNENSKKIVEYLLKAAANVNLEAKDGHTALSIASMYDCNEIIESLKILV